MKLAQEWGFAIRNESPCRSVRNVRSFASSRELSSKGTEWCQTLCLFGRSSVRAAPRRQDLRILEVGQLGCRRDCDNPQRPNQESEDGIGTSMADSASNPYQDVKRWFSFVDANWLTAGQRITARLSGH